MPIQVTVPPTGGDVTIQVPATTIDLPASTATSAPLDVLVGGVKVGVTPPQSVPVAARSVPVPAHALTLTVVVSAVVPPVDPPPTEPPTVRPLLRDFAPDASSVGKTFAGYDFVSASASHASLQLVDNYSHDMLFLHCRVLKNTGGWNGVAINDFGATVHDLIFDDLLIEYQSRFAFECTSRSASKCYQNVQLINSIIKPQGGGGVSFDGTSDVDCKCVVDNNEIQGTGNLAGSFTASWETNGPRGMRFTHNRIWQGLGAMWNIQRHVTTDCGWVFTDNVLDATHHDPDQKTPMTSASACVEAENIYGGLFARNVVKCAAPGGGVGYLLNCHNMDWRGSTFNDPRGGAWASLKLQSGSAGNQF